MKYKVTFIMLMLLAMTLNSAFAGSSRRIGTAGAHELRLPIGARGIAMGGAMIADARGVEAMFWNPAGLANLQGSEAMFSHQPYIADIGVNFAGIATNIEGFGTIGVSAKIISIGDINQTTEEFPDGNGIVFNPTFSVLTVSYSRIMTYRVSIGLNLKFIQESILNSNASGAAADFGIIYNPDWHGMTLGLSIRNYGPPMSFSGSGSDRPLDGRVGSAESADFELPSSFNIGLSYDLYNQERSMAKFSGNFASNNFSEDLWQSGMEYVYDGKYSLRAGYNYSNQDDWLYGFSAGAGLVYDMGGTLVTLEYAWTETEFFDANQYFTVKASF